MKTLYCKVGRAAPFPLVTGSDAEISAVQQNKTADLLRSGVDLSRVEFTVSGGAAAKKGK
jgi:hypothetical protein